MFRTCPKESRIAADDGRTNVTASLTYLGDVVAKAIAKGRARDAGLSPINVEASEVVRAIRRVAEILPGIGYKRLARILTVTGMQVTRTQVADVLAHPNSAWKRKTATAIAPRKPGLVIHVTAGAQRSRTAPITELCPSCGVRISLAGLCLCS